MEYHTAIKTIATCNNMDDSPRCDAEKETDAKEYKPDDPIYVTS